MRAERKDLHARLDRLLAPRLGHAPTAWPRRVHELVDGLARAERRTPEELLDELLASGDDLVLGALVDAATIGHTAFFRHPDQFAELTHALTTRLSQHTTPVAIWCAGCSTGEEAYSLALTAERAGVACRILATDVNPVAVELARAGSYSSLRPGQLPGPPECLEWQAPQALRAMIRFEVAALADLRPVTAFGKVDFLFCRNVLIYFERSDVPAVLDTLATTLALGGALIVSPADAVLPSPACLARGSAPGWFHIAPRRRPSAAIALTRTSTSPTSREHPGPRAAALVPANPIDRAAQLLGSGRGQEAEVILTQLLNEHPASGAAWFLLGEALAQRGERAQARAAFERASRSAGDETDGIDASALRWAAERRAKAP